MAQHQKQTVDYFPHYANASTKKTLTIMQSKYGDTGYAVWFKLLETLASSEGHSLNCSLPDDWEYLNTRLGVGYDKATEILGLLSAIGAIDKILWEKGKIIWSDNFISGVAEVYKNRKRTTPPKPTVPQNYCKLPVGYSQYTEKLPPQSRGSRVEEVEEVEGSLQQQKNAFSVWEECTGKLLNQGLADEIKILVDEFGEQLTMDAIKDSVKTAKNGSFNILYVQRKLDGWKREGKGNGNTAHLSPEDTARLNDWWVKFDRLYPKCDNKTKGINKAKEMFLSMNPDDILARRIVQSVEWHNRVKWDNDDDGQFIPSPTTFLADKYWESKEAIQQWEAFLRREQGGVHYGD